MKFAWTHCGAKSLRMSGTLVSTCVKSNLRRVRAESSRRPARHRRDACSMAWRCRCSPLDGASAATSSPRNDLVKNRRRTRRTVGFHTVFRRASRIPRRYQTPRAWHRQNHSPSAIAPRRAAAAAPWAAHAMEWSAYVRAQRCIRPSAPTNNGGISRRFAGEARPADPPPPEQRRDDLRFPSDGYEATHDKSSGRNPCNRFHAVAELSAYLPSSPQSLIVCMSIFFVAMCSQAPSDVPSSRNTRRHASTTDASRGTANSSRTRWARSCTLFSCLSRSSSRVRPR